VRPTVYLLPDHIRAALLEYLLSRPFREVEQGVAALRELEKVPAPQPALVAVPDAQKE
jgi:hypothetical protein